MRTVDPWFPFRRSSPAAKIRLFCLPPAGGGATLFRAWPQLLPPSIEVCAIQLPGREGRIAEDAIPRMGPLVDATASAMAPILDLPFAFFGHSMGALVGFEIVRCLRRLGRGQPMHLFASAVPAPHHPDPDTIHQLSDDAIVAKLRAEEGSGFPEDVLDSPELMEMLLPLLRADAAVTETYEYVAEEPLACPITVFAGTHDEKMAPEAVRDWRTYARGPFRELILPGGHDFLKTRSPQITQAIARALVL
jgi:medium-chain acyl-[acyl-carrier-protein] hydrolase